MKNIYHLIVKDIVRFFNDKPAFILTFIVPMLLIVIFGNVFSGKGGGPRGKTDIILVNNSTSIVADLIESKLDTSKSLRMIKKYLPENSNDSVFIDEELAKEFVRTGKIMAAIVMPKDFFLDTSSALKFKFYYDPKNEIESAIVQGAMQQTIMTQIPKVMPIIMKRKAINYIGGDSTARFYRDMSRTVTKYFGVDSDSIMQNLTKVDSSSLFSSSSDTSAEVNFMGNIIQFENEQLVGKEITNPGLTRSVGGWAIMFLLFSITGAASSLFEEKQEGTLKRLLCMTVSRADILWSKYIYSTMLGVIQLLVLFVFSWAFFDIDIFSNFFNLMIIIIVSAMAAVSFAMLITSTTKTASQANGVSTLLILVMSALGGSWFPIQFMPEWMQTGSKATMTYWSVEAFLSVLWRNAPLSSVYTNIVVLLVFTVLLNTYSLVRFRNGRVF
ncbi:MAG: ABC transporter permease [Melioribacteraceae bacterium]